MKRITRLSILQKELGLIPQTAFDYTDLDSTIYPLLLLMNLSGNRTKVSCGGHSTGRLRCWKKGGPEPFYGYGGYVDFIPRDDTLLRDLKVFLSSESEVQEDDVWFYQKLGIGLRPNVMISLPSPPNEGIERRISWYFVTYKQNRNFEGKLELFFMKECAKRFRI